MQNCIPKFEVRTYPNMKCIVIHQCNFDTDLPIYILIYTFFKCRRYFIGDLVLKRHLKSKPHKRRYVCTAKVYGMG